MGSTIDRCAQRTPDRPAIVMADDGTVVTFAELSGTHTTYHNDAALEAELIDYCRARLGHYQCPRSIDFDAELPRLSSGKLLKRLIKDRYWQHRTSRVI